jgi:hypothetical protein
MHGGAPALLLLAGAAVSMPLRGAPAGTTHGGRRVRPASSGVERSARGFLTCDGGVCLAAPSPRLDLDNAGGRLH